MSEKTSRRRLLSGVAGLGAIALAGCVGENGTKVQEKQVVVDGEVNVSKIELDIRSQETNEWTASESSITVYPEDNVVCYGEGDGKSEHTGCVRSEELTEKYIKIYQRETEESG